MKKILLIAFLLFSVKCFASPSNVMDISPAAVADDTITADDENTRNNEISTKYNAHSHSDITSSVSNDWKIGDGQAGNKYFSADNGSLNIPSLRFNDTSGIWQLTNNGVNFYELILGDTDQTILGTKTFDAIDINGGTIDGTTLGEAAAVAISNTSTLVASANLDIGAYEMRALTFESDQATGTAPFTIASTTVVTNLNADKLDAQTGAYYLDCGNATGTLAAARITSDVRIKGWVQCNSSTVVQDSYNVASVTDNSAGDYTINWDTDFANDNYAVTVSLLNPTGTADAISVEAVTVGTTQVYTRDPAGGTRDAAFFAIAIGDQ